MNLSSRDSKLIQRLEVEISSVVKSYEWMRNESVCERRIRVEFGGVLIFHDKRRKMNQGRKYQNVERGREIA